MALYSDGAYPLSYFQPSSAVMAQAVETLLGLPDLTDREKAQIKGLSKGPEGLARVLTDLNGYFLNKREVEGELERLVESALRQTDELRSYYLSRLIKAADASDI